MTSKRIKQLGPYTSAFYSTKTGKICLKKQDGSYDFFRCLPSCFIQTKDMERFDIVEYKPHVLRTINQGTYTKIEFKPNIRRVEINEILDDLENLGIETFETDVSPIRRFLTDNPVRISTKYKSLFFDLEADPLRLGFDDYAKQEHRIISFSAQDQFGHKWFCAAKSSSDKEEIKVIKKLLSIAEHYDVLLAWNGDNYDFYVLKERCKKHNIRVHWAKWNLLDYMLVVKKLLSSIPDPDFKRSFALDSVGENILGLKKIKLTVPMGQLKLLLGEREEELKLYNERDVEIMIEVEKKREFLALHYALCSICNTFPGRTSVFPNELADGILLRLARLEGKRLGSRNLDEMDIGKYEGAYVMNPIIGFHQNIQVPDFASLYPSIIISWNMSNETLITNGDKYDCYSIAHATGNKFRTDFEGMIPKALRQLMQKRKEYSTLAQQKEVGSEEWKNLNRLSTAVKVAANSFYGLLGSSNSRYYSRETARSVTLTGQLLIKKVIRYFENKGYRAIAGDTDSVFIECDEEIMKSELNYINQIFLPNIIQDSGGRECAIKMDFDKGFSSILMITKKRYAGRLALFKGVQAKEGTLEIKGLETQRSDQLKFGQALQQKYISLLLDPKINPYQIDTQLRNDGQSFFRKKFNADELTITEGVSKNLDLYSIETTAVRVAKQMIKEGMEFFVGMKIPYIVVSSSPKVEGIHVSHYNGTFDRKYYWEKRILPPIERMLEARFPNHPFAKFDNPNQFTLFGDNMTTTKKIKKVKQINQPKKKIKKIKKVKPTVSVEIYIPNGWSNNLVQSLTTLIKGYPGKYHVYLLLTIESTEGPTEIKIDTKVTISQDGIDVIKQTYPKIKFIFP